MKDLLKLALAGLTAGALATVATRAALEASGNPTNAYDQYRAPWPQGITEYVDGGCSHGRLAGGTTP